jgi:hypothetical protein
MFSMRWYEWVVAVVMFGGPLYLVILGPAIDDFRGARAGFADAQSDLATGHLRVQFGGKWKSFSHKAEKLAYVSYGIELVNTGCVQTPYKNGYLRAYNHVMQQAIDQRFANVSLDSIWRETESLEESEKHGADGS